MTWWSELVCEPYPSVKIFDSDREITISELKRFVRIILTEGIPFAFAKNPMAFEFGRQRAASRIGVDPKQISVTGSARVGYSLSPRKFGQVYDPSASDIDLFLVDANQFAVAAQEYTDFVALFESGKLHPRGELERTHWTEAKPTCTANIRKGFIDQKYVPTFDRFPASQRLGDAKYKFQVNVNSVVGEQVVKKASLRVYRDWNTAVDQIAFSLMGTLDGRRKTSAATKS